MMQCLRLPILVCVLMLVALHSRAGMCQGRLISVTGKGTVPVHPDRLVARLSIEGKGETAGKAMESMAALRQTLEDHLNPMDFPGTQLVFDGPVVSSTSGNIVQQMMFMGVAEAGEDANQPFAARETFSIRLELEQGPPTEAAIQMLLRAVDKAVDDKASSSADASSALGLGSAAPIIRLESTGLEAARKEASQKAFEAARARAMELAALAGVELGAVHSIRELAGPEAARPKSGETDGLMMLLAMQAGSLPASQSEQGLGQPIQVNVELAVDFEIRGTSVDQ